MAWKWLTSNRLGYLLVTGWALAGAIATVGDFRLIQILERSTQAAFFQVRGPVSPPNNIVILAIDEQSLSQGQQYQLDPKKYSYLEPLKSWPWKRAAYATVIDRLMAAGARAVAVDIIFADPSSYGTADDARLRETLQRHQGRITLVAVYEDSFAKGGNLMQLVYPNPVLYPTAGQASSTLPSIGFINYLTEADGRIRLLASQFKSRKIEPLGLDDPLLPFSEATLHAAKIPYPLPRGNEIFFYGPHRTNDKSPRFTFPYISFSDVLEPDWNQYLKRGVFKDKIVLIGPTATSLQDLHRTPVSGSGRYPTLMPGIEVHANAIATLMENRAIADAFPMPWQRGGLVLIGVLASGWLLGKFAKRPVMRAFLALTIATLWGIAGYLMLIYAGFTLPTAVPVLLIALSGLSYLVIGAINDQVEKLRIRRTLERYVAAPVVREILSQPEDFRALLQGRKLKAAVMFCDIRGFTNLSAKLPPEQLVAQLNTYLNVMVQAIVAARGTVDKFIGDAVMAEFGSPVSQGEKTDALNAIKAALTMRKALATLRHQWQQQGEPTFFNGIGISFGEVIAGNVGSVQRLEYTVIGDTVNIASRVEGLTKELITDILITDSLYTLVENEVEAIYLGERPLRGREGMVGLYSLISLKGEDAALYHQVQAELRQAREARMQEEV